MARGTLLTRAVLLYKKQYNRRKRELQDAPAAQASRRASHGEPTSEAIADCREAAALKETATELVFGAFVSTLTSSENCRGLLRPEEAEAQPEAIKARVTAALAMRDEAAVREPPRCVNR
jgi:hypothetical protein